MMESDSNSKVLEYVRRRAGDYFRGFAMYSIDGSELLASRPDLNKQMMTERVEELYQAVRTKEEFEAVDTLGPPSAIIQLRDEAVLINFPIDHEQGYLLGMEPEAARDLHSFVTDCHRLIHDIR